MEKIIIDLKQQEKEIYSLPFSGNNGVDDLRINNHYFEKNGKPWFPVMGEFHYSRFNENEWDRELAKMKSGGIDIVASYVIWIHHEEIKGEWEFEEQKNLREFIKKCQENNMYFFLRIGPWAHGEVRNGGLPDWLQNGDYELRSNNQTYLSHVEEYFKQIFQQVEGLFFKDGGPIIGIQIENEYGHAGGLRGEKGQEHMLTLKEMLLEIGYEVPFYTATGWGGGVVVDGEMLPVFGGYVDAPWDQGIEELPANENFVFSSVYNDPLIASDFQVAGTNQELYDFEIEKYPYLTAELGGGLQVTKLRRPLVTAKDTEVQSMVKLGSGTNLLGYYMYHGGTNPQGKLTTLEENKATGSYTDVPKLTYDFQAPLGEFGIIHESYGSLRKLHTFISSFQDMIARSHVQFADKLITDPEDMDSVRYSIRYDKETQAGFVFVNNYQRLRKMSAKDVEFVVKLEKQEIVFPKLALKTGSTAILPFNLRVGHYHLLSSNASLLSVIENQWVFYHENPSDAEVVFNGECPKVIIISEAEANQSLLVDNKLFVSEADLWMEKDSLSISSKEEEVTLKEIFSNKIKSISYQPAESSIQITNETESSAHSIYDLTLGYNVSPDTMDVLLEVDFTGDKAELYNEEGILVADWYTIGNEWLVSLKTFDYPLRLKLVVYPTVKETYYEVPIDNGCELNTIETITQYQKHVKI